MEARLFIYALLVRDALDCHQQYRQEVSFYVDLCGSKDRTPVATYDYPRLGGHALT